LFEIGMLYYYFKRDMKVVGLSSWENRIKD